MNNFLVLLVLALVASSCGFRKYVWFISIGYGAAVALVGIGLLVMFGGSLTAGTALQCALFVVYGCRLAGYLLYREAKTAYNRRMKGEVKSNEGVPLAGKVGIWASASLLYVLQTSPVLFRLANASGTDAFCIVGLLISATGLALETTADLQKNRAKKANPKRFVDTGLFRLVRCPTTLARWSSGPASLSPGSPCTPTRFSGSAPSSATWASFTSCSAERGALRSGRTKTTGTTRNTSGTSPRRRS